MAVALCRYFLQASKVHGFVWIPTGPGSGPKSEGCQIRQRTLKASPFGSSVGLFAFRETVMLSFVVVPGLGLRHLFSMASGLRSRIC